MYHFFVVKASIKQRNGGSQCCRLFRGMAEVVFFFDWLPFLSAVCVKHWEGKKRKTKPTTHTGGWQHSAYCNPVCAELRPMEGKKTREQCMFAGRLEEIGCVAVGGRGRESQQCQCKPDELPSVKLGERAIKCTLRSRAVGKICKTKTPA